MTKNILTFILMLTLGIVSGQKIDATSAMIQLRSGQTIETLTTEVQAAQLIEEPRIRLIVPDLMIYRLDFKSCTGLETFEAFAKMSSTIDHFHEAQELEWRTEPNDSRYSDQYHAPLIGLEDIWNTTTGGVTALDDPICIAIIESGIQLDHPDLEDRIWVNRGEIANDGLDNDGNGYIDDVNGVNFRNSTGQHQEDFHGTGVTGIVGAEGNNGIGVSGVNWNSQLMILTEARNSITIVEAFQYVIDQRRLYNDTGGDEGAFVVATNFSAGINGQWGEDFPMWCGMYDLLGAEGILNVSATTNDNVNVDEFGDMPSTCPSEYLIVTTSSNEADQLSNRGFGQTWVDIAAPGEGLTTTDLDGGYQLFSGTSSATPVVTGVIGLMHSIPCEDFARAYKSDPESVARDLKRYIMNSVVPKSDMADKIASGGRLDAYSAFLNIVDRCDFNLDGTLLELVDNGSSGALTFRYSTESTETVNLTLYDAAGKIILDVALAPSPLVISQEVVELGGDWPVGIYFARLTGPEDDTVLKFFIG